MPPPASRAAPSELVVNVAAGNVCVVATLLAEKLWQFVPSLPEAGSDPLMASGPSAYPPKDSPAPDAPAPRPGLAGRGSGAQGPGCLRGTGCHRLSGCAHRVEVRDLLLHRHPAVVPQAEA